MEMQRAKTSENNLNEEKNLEDFRYQISRFIRKLNSITVVLVKGYKSLEYTREFRKKM